MLNKIQQEKKTITLAYVIHDTIVSDDFSRSKGKIEVALESNTLKSRQTKVYPQNVSKHEQKILPDPQMSHAS